MEYPQVWFLPCNESPFVNRKHPVFLAIRDQVVDCDNDRIRLENFGWVRPASCCKTRDEAEAELFRMYEEFWLDYGLIAVKTRSTLRDFYHHSGKAPSVLPWFDLFAVLNGQENVTSRN